MTSEPQSPAPSPWAELALAPGASDEAIRAAYLAAIKQHPPDREPARFERLRDAYAKLRDPQWRAAREVLAADPQAPLQSLFAKELEARAHTGPEPWLAVLDNTP